MQGNCFEYKATTNDTCINSGSGSIFVKYDHSAVTTAGGGNTNEPAWSFRLWNGSIYLSRYLESIAPELHDKTIIDLGSGTGLTSIVLGKYCGVRRVFATDLQHAMPLLSHNIAENFVSKSNLSEQLHGLPEPPNKSCPTCPASHTLIPVIADCEDYMCNVCDFDIVEDSCIHRCVECNFDICVKCMSKVASGDMASFPEWFRLQLQSNAPREVDSGVKVVIPCVYDWSSKDSLVEFVNEISTVNECDDMRVQYLVGADVTYSLKSIDLFFAAVVDLTATLRAKSTCAATTPSETTLLFSHHNRSDDTNEYMLNQLRLNFEGRYEVIQFQELGREDREDSANDLTGDMAIYRVQL
jgi:SAM-dependent methyltransferase